MILAACGGTGDGGGGDGGLAGGRDGAAAVIDGEAPRDGRVVSTDGALPPPSDAAEPARARVLWTYEHDLQVHFGPALDAAGNLYFQGKAMGPTPTDGPTLVSLDPRGVVRWGRSTNPGSVPAPGVTLVGDVVAAPATFSDGGNLVGRVHRFAVADGAVLTPLLLAGPVGDLAALRGDLLIVPSSTIHAFRGETEVFGFDLEGDGKSGTNIAIGPNGDVYVGCRGEDRNLYALDGDGNVRRHAVSVGGDLCAAVGGGVGPCSFLEPIAIDGAGKVYAMDSRGLLMVFNSDLSLDWRYQVPEGHSGGGLVVDGNGVVYFGVFTEGLWIEPLLYAVREAADGVGEVLWKTATGYWIDSTPALSAGGTLYVGDACRTFVAVEASTGVIRWRHAIPVDDPATECAGSWSSPTIAPDGTVYASIEGARIDGTMFAFEGDGTGLSTAAPWPGEQRDTAHRGSLFPAP